MASSSSSDKILRNNSSVVVQKITKIEGNNILISQPEGISKIELDYEKSSIAWKRFIKVLVDGYSTDFVQCKACHVLIQHYNASGTSPKVMHWQTNC